MDSGAIQMMLSRVAERLYWMARYLERAEDTARLLNAYSHLILDIPHGVEPGWQLLINTFDAMPAYALRYKNLNERNVAKFLLADPGSPSSIRYSLKAARENVRTSRDVLPVETWELVNECYLFVEEVAASSISRQRRFECLDEIIGRNQRITGLIASSVLRDQALWFMQLGALIERADMTSRIIDVGAEAIVERSKDSVSEIPLLWANLLKSMSAKNAFQRRHGPILNPNTVINFIFRELQFPRSLLSCIHEIEEVVGLLRGPAGMMRLVRRLSRSLRQFDADDFSVDELHTYIDEFQVGINDLNDDFEVTWFRAERT